VPSWRHNGNLLSKQQKNKTVELPHALTFASRTVAAAFAYERKQQQCKVRTFEIVTAASQFFKIRF